MAFLCNKEASGLNAHMKPIYILSASRCAPVGTTKPLTTKGSVVSLYISLPYIILYSFIIYILNTNIFTNFYLTDVKF